jgi:hypothetical protein
VHQNHEIVGHDGTARYRRNWCRVAFITAGLVGVSSCANSPLTCPDAITYQDGIVHITSVTSATGDVSGPFTLSNFTLDSATTVRASELLVNVPNTSATVSNNALVCASTSHREFGTSRGKYAFTLSAPGFSAKTVIVDATYATRVKSGPCVIGYKDGTQVSVTLP